jgi:hypothetical protein
MSCHVYPGNETFTAVEAVAEIVFLGVYTSEALVKILGLGFAPYFAVR